MRVFNNTLNFSGSASGDMSGSLTSSAQMLDQMFFCSIVAVFTGAPVGTLKLQFSNDNSANGWVDYTGSSTAISAAGNFGWIIDFTPYLYIRVVYTRTSGTGSLGITVHGKGN